MSRMFDKIAEARGQNRPFVVCTIVAVRGSTPREPGARMIVYADGTIEGTIGGGSLEEAVICQARHQMEAGEPGFFRHDLLHQHNMCCGGSVDVFIEPVALRRRLYVFGAGHTGQALLKMTAPLDFDSYLIDDRKEYLDRCTLPEVSKMNLPFPLALSALPFDDHTYACILTYSHPIDREILAACLRRPFAYLGMIGSRRKVEMTRKMFREGLGFTDEELDRVDMPMGLELGAEGPEEIAVSILAKLIAVKNKVNRWKKELQS